MNTVMGRHFSPFLWLKRDWILPGGRSGRYSGVGDVTNNALLPDPDTRSTGRRIISEKRKPNFKQYINSLKIIKLMKRRPSGWNVFMNWKRYSFYSCKMKCIPQTLFQLNPLRTPGTYTRKVWYLPFTSGGVNSKSPCIKLWWSPWLQGI